MKQQDQKIIQARQQSTGASQAEDKSKILDSFAQFEDQLDDFDKQISKLVKSDERPETTEKEDFSEIDKMLE